MMKQTLRRAAAGVAVALALAAGLWLGSAADPAPGSRPAAHVHGETVWTCSMHPQVELPEPGPCPICGMDLIPRESDRASAKATASAEVWTCSMHPQVELPESGPCPICGMDLIAREANQPTAAAASAEVWTCSMHPQVELPESGPCPICGMDLIPREGGGAGSDRTLTLTPEAVALARVRTVPVERRAVAHTLRLSGEVAYDPTRLVDVTAHFAGRIERMFVDYVGMRVRKSDHLYQIYSPDLVTAHEELRAAKRALGRVSGSSEAVRSSAQRTLDAVRDRLRRWGLSRGQVERLESQRKAPERLTMYAPTGGVVIEQARLEGSYVETGTRLYRIADLDYVWLEAWAYEQHLPWIRFGQPVEFTVAAVPGRVFTGRVATVDPFIEPDRRAARVRISVQNADRALKPGMFARVVVTSALTDVGRVMEPSLAGQWVCPMHPHVVEGEPGRCPVCGMRLIEADALTGADAVDRSLRPAPPVVVPRSAPLWTGERAVIYVEVPGAAEPTYEGREVVLGPEAGEWVVVREGVVEGERVVAEGAFKLDASLQILAKPSMMNPAEGGTASQPTLQPTSQPQGTP